MKRRSSHHRLQNDAPVMQCLHVSRYGDGFAVEIIRFPAKLGFNMAANADFVRERGDFWIDNKAKAGIGLIGR